jgi:hypothetical protein
MDASNESTVVLPVAATAAKVTPTAEEQKEHNDDQK